MILEAAKVRRPGSELNRRAAVPWREAYRDHASSADVFFATPFASLPALRETLVPKTSRAKTQDAKEREEDRVSMESPQGRGESLLPGVNPMLFP
jgi:hypothetical protein